MSSVDMLTSDTDESLRASVRRLLDSRCKPELAGATYDGGGRAGLAELWVSLAETLGLAALLVPEAKGGHGASAREAAVVLEELGRNVAPVPFLTSAVIATTVLADSDTGLLQQVADGSLTAALVVPWAAMPGADIVTASESGGSVTGSVRSVAGALDADVLLVPARGPGDDSVSIYWVEATAADVIPVVSLDMTRQVVDIDLRGVPGRRIEGADDSSIRRALTAGAALLASEQVGVARWCLDETVSYLKQRRQFGRTVGGFQALKHRLASLYVEVESASAAAWYAAATVAEGDPDSEIAMHVAQSYCSDVAVRAAEAAVQLHAGIGMTWEHPAHLYLKRAKADQIALGTPGRHRSRLAELVDLPS